jgi:hypothetical protein
VLYFFLSGTPHVTVIIVKVIDKPNIASRL